MESEDTVETFSGAPSSGRRRWRWAALAAVLAVVLGIGLAALGGAWGGGSPKASSDPSSGSVASSWSTARVLAYAECMRAHGVTNYPEPGGSGEITGTGIDRGSPTYQAAAEKCYKLMPGDPAATAHATEKQITQALEAATCMRDHGVPSFPDPIVTSKPPTFGGNFRRGTGGGNEMYSNGILFEIPSSVVDSPTYQAAAKTCDLNNW